MSREDLLKRLNHVQLLATASKWRRLLENPGKYLYAILHRELIYPWKKIEVETKVETFTGRSMHIFLPSSTDIYLTKGKSHHSEIALARYLINNLKDGAHFMDIGAHYGYFTQLAAELVGENGKMVAVEAAPKTYRILSKNLEKINNAKAVHAAISAKQGRITFYEFPNRFAEYNTIDISQYQGQKWFKNNPPQKVEVDTKSIEDITAAYEITPQIIKIDVEGAEYFVIQGGESYLRLHHPQVIMEYLSEKRGDTSHQKASALLKEMGYQPFALLPSGEHFAIESEQKYLSENKIDSDNILYLHQSI